MYPCKADSVSFITVNPINQTEQHSPLHWPCKPDRATLPVTCINQSKIVCNLCKPDRLTLHVTCINQAELNLPLHVTLYIRHSNIHHCMWPRKPEHPSPPCVTPWTRHSNIYHCMSPLKPDIATFTTACVPVKQTEHHPSLWTPK